MSGPADRQDAGAAGDGEAPLVIDIDGFEGPLDLLLTLARRQRVDLARMSILALAEQYLAFVEDAGRRRLEVAGEYLVMAAWLAFLKSRLLLPEPPAADEADGAALAAALAERLRRLEAIRAAAGALEQQPRLGRDWFARGMPEMLGPVVRPVPSAQLHGLSTAYAGLARRVAPPAMVVGRRAVWTLSEARAVLVRMLGSMAEWTPLEIILSPWLGHPGDRRTALASTFGASLELVREGRLAIRQPTAFGPLEFKATGEGGGDG